MISRFYKYVVLIYLLIDCKLQAVKLLFLHGDVFSNDQHLAIS